MCQLGVKEFLMLGLEYEQMKPQQEGAASHLMQRRFINLWTMISSGESKQTKTKNLYFRFSDVEGAKSGIQVFSLKLPLFLRGPLSGVGDFRGVGITGEFSAMSHRFFLILQKKKKIIVSTSSVELKIWKESRPKECLVLLLWPKCYLHTLDI